jgi:tetratricopeptide (TPR) repeat protein
MRRRSFFQVTDRGDGEIDLFWLRVEGAAMRLRHFSRALPFADPVTADDRTSLRWYLEDLLRHPLSAERSRARHIEERMQLLGAALYQQVFRTYDEGLDPRACYAEAVDDGLGQCELRVVSDDLAFLGIPWEMLYALSEGFLGLELGGVLRQPIDQQPAPAPLPPGTPLRVLLVAPRPRVAADSVLRTVARALPRAVRDLWPRLQIEVLREPTFSALQRELAEQPGRYHVVHVDGQADLSADGQSGRLLFETADGAPNRVTARALAEALSAGQARLLVLSAARSAREAPVSPHTALGSELMAAGVPSAVVLPYALEAGAAEHLFGPFYARLLDGAGVAEAVMAGRRTLSLERRRPSPSGPIALQDWFVPMLYQQSGEYQLVRAAGDPAPADEQAAPGAEAVAPGVIEQQARARAHAAEVCRAGRFGLLGRDDAVLRLDRALRDPERPWALLTGPGGIGKSTLALDFGRWYLETGGSPGGVFAASFESRADLAQVIGSIVPRRADFWRYGPEERTARLLAYLRETPCLLILDRVETAAGYPPGATPLASERERQELAGFLQGLRGGRSRVLLTSRNAEEPWLEIEPARVPLDGLAIQPAGVLASLVLRTIGKNPTTLANDRDYPRLLELLQGHPRALEVSLPLLRWLAPGELLDVLKQAAATVASPLEAYHTVALERLSATAQRHLPAAGLFSGIVNADIAAMMCALSEGGPDGYAAIVGEAPDRAGWRAILAEAASAGLVSHPGGVHYRIHPTIVPVLRRRLVAEVGEQGLRNLERVLASFLSELCGKLVESVRRGEASAMNLLTFEEPNLLRALRMAGRAGDWPRVFPIARVISELFEAQGRHDEWARLRDTMLGRLGPTVPAESGGGDLWRFLNTSEAREALRRRDYDAAEQIYRRLLAHFQSWSSPRAVPALATTSGQLGRVAEERGAFAEAETWYLQALEMRDSRGQGREAAGVAMQLGAVTQAQDHFEAAESWYTQAIERFTQLGLEREAATAMQRLGQMALSRGQLADADTWLQQATLIAERLDLAREAASIMQSLGQVARQRGHLDEAELWQRRALERFEQLGLTAECASALFMLGSIAEERQHLDEADGLLARAARLAEEAEIQGLRLDALLALARVQEGRRDLTAVVSWLGEALHVATEHEPLRRLEVLQALARVSPTVGTDRLRRVWQALFPGERAPLDEIAQASQRPDPPTPAPARRGGAD